MDTRFKKGHKMTKEMKKKISQALKGRMKSADTLRRMSEAQKKNKAFVSKETGEKIRQKKLGKKASMETRIKMSLAQKGPKGNKWKGGITPVTLQIRHLFETRQLVSDCFYRDDFTCQDCGTRGGKLNAHHIKYFSKILEEYSIKTVEQALQCFELWNLNNMKTLCEKCHKLIHKKNG